MVCNRVGGYIWIESNRWANSDLSRLVRCGRLLWATISSFLCALKVYLEAISGGTLTDFRVEDPILAPVPNQIWQSSNEIPHSYRPTPRITPACASLRSGGSLKVCSKESSWLWVRRTLLLPRKLSDAHILHIHNIYDRSESAASTCHLCAVERKSLWSDQRQMPWGDVTHAGIARDLEQ